MLSTFLGDNDGHDHAVDTEDTRHDHGDKGFHHHRRFPDGDAADSGSCLGCSVGCPEVCLLADVLARTRAMLTPINPKKADALSGGDILIKRGLYKLLY
jgi:hypothetical protein